MILFGLEEFATKRRGTQTEIEDNIRSAVERGVDTGLDTGGWREVLTAVRDEFERVYDDEFGLPHGPDPKFMSDVEDTLKKTSQHNDATVDRITIWLATAILTQATIQAADNDPEELFLEWVDMGDNKVRETHLAAHGQQRPSGDKFKVGGYEMSGPGDPTVPIELWINCRCTLRPVLASEALTASTTGVAMTDTTTEKPVDEAPTPAPGDKGQAEVQVPWHGILAPEGVKSGDGRMFAADSLRMRDLPLPLTWQKASSDGHSGSITVAKIEKIERVDGMMQASGHFLATAEADEVIGLLSEFGKFGVSVDADDAEFELDEDNEMVVFTSARIASASIVAIPAFAEAYVALGYWDKADVTDPVEAPVAAGKTAEFKDLAPGRTEDGPGWLTNPEDTDRLRDYWVRGPGAAKIGWGAPGDFNRCRINLAEYVKPQYLNGYCANRHYDALGIWPGQEAKAADSLEMTEASPAVALVASIAHTAPADWFKNPNLSEPTALTITDEGEVFGHLAEWGTCHIGIRNMCQIAPHSASNYAWYANGQVPLDDGTRASTGPLTVGGGHADRRLGLQAAIAHYDSTSSVFADVSIGEDEHGIWYHGWIRPGTSKETVNAAMGSAISGDWREVNGELDLVAALAVNVNGFQSRRTRALAAAVDGHQVSLVAAGMVTPKTQVQAQPDAVEKIAASLAEQVAAALEQRQARRDKMAALAAKYEKAGK